MGFARTQLSRWPTMRPSGNSARSSSTWGCPTSALDRILLLDAEGQMASWSSRLCTMQIILSEKSDRSKVSVVPTTTPGKFCSSIQSAIVPGLQESSRCGNWHVSKGLPPFMATSGFPNQGFPRSTFPLHQRECLLRSDLSQYFGFLPLDVQESPS